MTATVHRPDIPFVDDPAVPWTALLGEDAADVLTVALGAVGGTLRGAVARQVTYHPGHSLTVRYDTTVTWAEGCTRTESLVAVGGKVPDGALVLGDGVERVGVWRVPHDPLLPGLAPVLDARSCLTLLEDLGAEMAGTAEVTPRLRAYRPGRRAVVEIEAAGMRCHVKLVPTDAVAGLQLTHTRLAGAVPVPRSLGWAPELGLVVQQTLPGATLRTELARGGRAPAASTLIGLLDRLPAPEVPARPVTGWSTERFARLIGAVAPDLAGRVDELAGELTAAEATIDEPMVAVHGDFHEAQVLVSRGEISGLLDVDTFGAGRRIDDLATMIGHLSTLALGSPHAPRLERYARGLLDHFDGVVDPVHLRYAVAAVVLGLATGPFRVLEPCWHTATERRVRLAQRWLVSARRVAGSGERTLTADSRTDHRSTRS